MNPNNTSAFKLESSIVIMLLLFLSFGQPLGVG